MVAGTILLAKVLFFVKHCKQQKTVPLQQFKLLDSDSGFCDNPTKSKSQICSWQTRNLQKKVEAGNGNVVKLKQMLTLSLLRVKFDHNFTTHNMATKMNKKVLMGLISWKHCIVTWGLHNMPRQTI